MNKEKFLNYINKEIKDYERMFNLFQNNDDVIIYEDRIRFFIKLIYKIQNGIFD